MNCFRDVDEAKRTGFFSNSIQSSVIISHLV